MYFYVFPRHPCQKQPWSHHYAFYGGSFRYPHFTVFPRHPRQKRPWSHHYGFCVGALCALIFYEVCSSGHSPDGSFGVRPGATGAPSLGPIWGRGRGLFFPAFRWWVERFFFRPPYKERPYLNMMRVTVIDKPNSEERVMVTHEGKEACCYVQGNA